MSHVVLFAGQSNMLGFGNTGPAPYLPNPRVQIWSPGIGGFEVMVPGWNTGTPANPAAWGPEVAFANRWLADHADGFLWIGKVAQGSTGLAQDDSQLDWSPASRGELFDAGAQVASAMLATLGVAQLDAVFWMQGEQDAADPFKAAAYQGNFESFLAAVRQGWMHDPVGQVTAGRITDSAALAFNWDVRVAQWWVDQLDPNLTTFRTWDFGRQADGLHYSDVGQLQLGQGFYDGGWLF